MRVVENSGRQAVAKTRESVCTYNSLSVGVKIHRADPVYHQFRPEATVRFAAHQSCAYHDPGARLTGGIRSATTASFCGSGDFTRRSISGKRPFAANASGHRILSIPDALSTCPEKVKTPDDLRELLRLNERQLNLLINMRTALVVSLVLALSTNSVPAQTPRETSAVRTASAEPHPDAAIQNGRMKLEFFRKPDGFAYAKVLASQNRGWTQVAAWHPLFRIVSDTKSAERTWEIRPHEARLTKMSRRSVEFVQTAHDADGVEWRGEPRGVRRTRRPAGPLPREWKEGSTRPRSAPVRSDISDVHGA